MSKKENILEYNDIFVRGINFIENLVKNEYINDIAEENKYNSSEEFIAELMDIWVEAYVAHVYNKNKLIASFKEIEQLTKFDHTSNIQSMENSKICDQIANRIDELSMYYDNNNKPVYDIDSILTMFNVEKNNLINARGKAQRKQILQKIQTSIEQSKY